MNSMFRILAIDSTQRARVLRWLFAAYLGLNLIGSALALSTATAIEFPGQAPSPSVKVKQTLWLDESRQLDFESARTQLFKPFNPFERLIISNKVAWLRLHIERVEDDSGRCQCI